MHGMAHGMAMASVVRKDAYGTSRAAAGDLPCGGEGITRDGAA
jgi:hypothetical protein